MKKILIADDSFFQRKMLKDIVSELDYETVEVSSGEELLKTMDETYDCIFLDLLMDGMSGIDVLKELKTRKNTIPVIVISADIQKARKEESLSLGARAFINKVVNKEELLSVLKEIFN